MYRNSGKSPLIVFEDADLQKAAKVAAFSIVFNSGQVCMASSRVYVQKSVEDEFTKLYAQAIQQLAAQAGNPLEATTGFGPQADRHQFKSITEYLQKAQRWPQALVPWGIDTTRGGKLCLPGCVPGGAGTSFYYEG